MSAAPEAWPLSIVARSSRRISSAVTSLTAGGASTAARAVARFGQQVLLEPSAVGGIASDALQQVGIGRDERQIEQLRIGFLLQVDALLLVALERHRLLD